MINQGAYKIDGVKNNGRIRIGVDTLNIAKQLIMNDPEFLDLWQDLKKTDNPIIEAEEEIVDRARLLHKLTSDRTFPLETVELGRFNNKHDKNIESATIHIGLGADEMSRSMNSLAFVLANDIFFRSNKFNPTTEEGRKLLAHELTHVAQNESNEYIGKQELEHEAEQAEIIEEEEYDKIESIEIKGKTYRFRRSEYKEIAHNIAHMIENWLYEQKLVQDERKYLKLLLAYKDHLSSHDSLWDAKTEIDILIANECKDILKRRSGIV